MATGYSLTGKTVPLIDSWNGKAWSLMTPAAPPPSINAGLTGVSCALAASCAAVGSAMHSTAIDSFSEIWNGKSWRAADVPLPGGAVTSTPLYGVSCPGTHRCVAVGAIESYSKGVITDRAASATWNGKTWTVISVPAPAKGKSTLLNAVTCLSATACVAVGQLGPVSPDGLTAGTGLSAFWNGKHWHLVAAN